MASAAREHLIARLADRITARKTAAGPLVVGITGMDTAGKSELALELAGLLSARGIHTQLVRVDDFHNPRALRYTADIPEPQRYFQRSIDFNRIADEVLSPIREAGRLDCSLTLLDLPSDTWTRKREYSVSEDTVVIVEGVFLFRPEVRPLIDMFIYLDVSEGVVLERARTRDVPDQGWEVLEKYGSKYLPAQREYLREHSFDQLADIVIDNSDWSNPVVTTWPSGPEKAGSA